MAREAPTIPGRVATLATCSRLRSSWILGTICREAYTTPRVRIFPSCGTSQRYSSTCRNFIAIRVLVRFCEGRTGGAVAPPPSPHTPLPARFRGAGEGEVFDPNLPGLVNSPLKGLGEGAWGRG